MDTELLKGEIDMYLADHARTPRSMDDVSALERAIYTKVRRRYGSMDSRREVSRFISNYLLLGRYKHIHDRFVARSVNSYSGRRKVFAARRAMGRLGGYALPVKSNVPASSAAVTSSSTMVDAPDSADLEDEMKGFEQPTGLFFAQPGRLRGRVVTVAFGEPGNLCKVVVPADGRKRVPSQRIDAARVAHWTRQDRKMYKQQNDIMGCSAHAAAISAQVATDLVPGEPLQWEWLHLCSFKMGGIDNQPQVAGNLVAGTYDCNTAMITIEDTLKALAMEGNVFDVEIEATLYPGTHLAMQIDYKVTCNGKLSTTHFFPMSTDAVMKGEITVAKELFRKYFGLPG